MDWRGGAALPAGMLCIVATSLIVQAVGTALAGWAQMQQPPWWVVTLDLICVAAPLTGGGYLIRAVAGRPVPGRIITYMALVLAFALLFFGTVPPSIMVALVFLLNLYIRQRRALRATAKPKAARFDAAAFQDDAEPDAQATPPQNEQNKGGKKQ